MSLNWGRKLAQRQVTEALEEHRNCRDKEPKPRISPNLETFAYVTVN